MSERRHEWELGGVRFVITDDKTEATTSENIAVELHGAVRWEALRLAAETIRLKKDANTQAEAYMNERFLRDKVEIELAEAEELTIKYFSTEARLSIERDQQRLRAESAERLLERFVASIDKCDNGWWILSDDEFVTEIRAHLAELPVGPIPPGLSTPSP